MEQVNALKELLNLLSPVRLLEAALILAFAWLTIQLLRLFLERLGRRFNRYRLHFARLFPILRLLLWSLAIGIVVLGIFRPSENMVFALSASIGIALGLAAQDALKNWLAGIFMMFNRPYHLGDMVHAAGHYGEVIGIDMTVTRLRTFDDNVVTIPNAEILRQAVANANAGALTEMVVVQFDLPATVDVTMVRDIAWEAAVSCPYTYLKRPIAIVVEDRFERTFLTRFKIKVYVVDVRLERLLASDIVERVKREVVACDLLSEQMVLGILHTSN